MSISNLIKNLNMKLNYKEKGSKKSVDTSYEFLYFYGSEVAVLNFFKTRILMNCFQCISSKVLRIT